MSNIDTNSTYVKQKNENPFFLLDSREVLAYERMIGSSAKLLQELHANDIFLSSVIVENLLWNGVYSIGGTYKYSNVDLVNLPTYQGMQITEGKGMCGNNTDLLYKILKRCDFEAYYAINKMKHGDSYYIPPIKREIGDVEEDNSIRKLFVEANHAFVLANHKGHFYVSDPTALCFFKVNGLRAKQYNGTCSAKIVLSSDHVGNTITSMSAINKVTNKANASSLAITDAFIRNTYETGITLCKDNESLVKDFRTEIFRDVSTINHILQKVRDLKKV